MREHLVVATDFSTPSKEMLANLDVLRDHGARKATLVYVRRRRYPTEDSAGHERYYQTLLEDHAGALEKRGWQVETRNELGRAGSTIVDVAGEVGADLIVLANRGRNAVEQVLLGSVATDVLERSGLPVFLFCDRAEPVSDQDGQPRLWDRIIHPTDFSDAADEALAWIPRMVADQPVPVQLMHVVDDRYYGPREGDERQQKLQQRHDRLQKAGIDQAESELVFGRPRKMLAEATDHYPGSLFVMGSHGHGWFEELMLGGVARAVARRASNHLLFVPG